MRPFEKLRALAAFEKQHLDFFSTPEEHRLVGEIGYHQDRGKPLTLKQVFLLGIGSIATVQRRLRGLKELGLVQHRRSASDRRAIELMLSPKCLRIIATYDRLMSSPSPEHEAAGASAEPAHVCGLCDGDAGGRALVARFLEQGLKRGDRCVLVASAEAQKGILAQLPQRRKATAQLIVSDGHPSVDAQFAFLKAEFQTAGKAGQALCLGAHMSWTFAKNLRMDAVLDVETRFDALSRQYPLTGLCVYDARHFSSGDFLRAVKCHGDHKRYPILVG